MLDPFLRACGIEPVLEFEVEADSNARAVRYSLRQPFAIVGRHPAADVYLDADGVRPRHLYFQAIEGRVACINVSQTGSFLVGETSHDTFCWLEPNESVRIGTKRIRLIPDEEVEVIPRRDVIDPLARGSAWDIFAPHITLEICNDEVPGITKTWLVDRLLTLVGSTPRCAIQLNKDQVSNVHCSLVLTSQGVWVVDLLGRGGIYINEEPIRAGFLGMDDELRIGTFRIRLQEPILSIPPTEGETVDGQATFEQEHVTVEQNVRPVGPIESHHQIRHYHTPWPEDPAQANLLEDLFDQLQEMKGQQFEKHEDLVSRLVQSFSQFELDQQDVVKNEMERLRSIQEEVNSIQQKLAAAPTGSGIVVPQEIRLSVTKDAEQMSDQLPPLSPIADPPSPPAGRSALSLLKDPDTSVFRMRTKKGDLFETARSSTNLEMPPAWAESRTEILSSEMVEEAQQLPQPEVLPMDGVSYGYDPFQHDQLPMREEDFQSLDEVQPVRIERPQEVADDKAVHLRLHGRIDELQKERASIWNKMASLLFGKSR